MVSVSEFPRERVEELANEGMAALEDALRQEGMSVQRIVVLLDFVRPDESEDALTAAHNIESPADLLAMMFGHLKATGNAYGFQVGYMPIGPGNETDN